MAKSGLMGGGAMQTPPIVADPGSVFRRGQGGILPERGSRAQRDLVQSLVQSGIQSAGRSGSPLLALLAPLAGGAVSSRTSGLYKDAQGKRDNAAVDQILAAMGGGAQPVSISARNANPNVARPNAADQRFPIGKYGPAPRGNVDPASGLNMGQPVNDAVSTSMDMLRKFEGFRESPYWDVNAHRLGYGSDTITNPDGSVRKVTKGDRVTREMADADLQRRVSQEFMPAARGAVGGEAFDRLTPNQKAALTSVTYNYGRLPSSVAQAVRSGDPQATAQAIQNLGSHNNGINAERRSKEANAFLGAVSSGDFSTYASMGQSSRMPQDSMRTLIGIMTNGEVSEPIREIAASMVTQGMKSGGSMIPSEQIDLASSMLSLEDAMRPPKPEGRFRAATPEEAALYGVDAGQFGPDGRFYPAPLPKNSRSGDAGVLRQQNEATEIISGAIENLEAQGFSREEAMATIARDPIYGPQLQILGIDPANIARQQVLEDAQPAQEQPGFWNWVFGGNTAPETAAPTQPLAPTTPENDPLGIR